MPHLGMMLWHVKFALLMAPTAAVLLYVHNETMGVMFECYPTTH